MKFVSGWRIGMTMCAGTRPCHIVLTGMMGVGKSTVGPLVAHSLRRDFRDVDQVVVDLAHQSIPEIFAQYGESRFREWERQALLTVLSSPQALVVALGGGAVLSPENREWLRPHLVIWLDAQWSELGKRVQGGGRPLLAGDGQAGLKRILAERKALYEEVSAVRIDTTGLAVVEVQAEIIRWLEEERKGEPLGSSIRPSEH